jgi:hypothetical protein
MLQRFIEWMDSWGDHINPLVVLSVRLFRNRVTIWMPCLYCVVVIILCLAGWFANLNCAKIFFVVSVTICWLGLSVGGVWASNITGLPIVDEMFRINTLSLRQYLHADITISIITSLFYISFAFLPLSVVQIIDIRWLNLPFLYIIPLLTFLIGQTMNLYFWSFDVHIPRHLKISYLHQDPTTLKQIKAVLMIVVFSFIAELLVVPFVGAAVFLWLTISMSQPFSIYNNFDFISLYFLLPIMLIVMSLAAYSLCVKGLRINRKIRFSGIFYNFVIYSILHICLLAIYFILVFFFR